MKTTMHSSTSSRASPQKQVPLTEDTIKAIDQLCQTGRFMDEAESGKTRAEISQERIEKEKEALAFSLEAQLREQLLKQQSGYTSSLPV